MSRPRSIPHQTRLTLPAFVIALIVLVLVPPPADAGIGNPIKKAKEKIGKTAEKAVGQATDQDAATAEVVYDDATIELTEARITRILAGYQAARKEGAGRPALVEKRNKLADERGKLDEKEGEKVRDLQRKRGDIEVCYHDGYQEARDRKEQEYAQRALTDPALREKFTRIAQENNAAAARGDSAAIARANAAIFAEILPSAEDSATVRKACGPLPPPSPAEVELDALGKQIGDLDGQIREIDDRIAKAQADNGGLTPEQWGIVQERIHGYLLWRQDHKPDSKDAPRGYSDEELKAMEGHLKQLKNDVR